MKESSPASRTQARASSHRGFNGALRVSSALLSLAAAAAISGCHPEHGASGQGGTLVVSVGADADVLYPPTVAGTVGRAITEQLFEPLAQVGDSLNVIGDRGFLPRLADSWTWGKDSLSIAFHLNPKARWHDGKPVTARDVKFTLRAYSDSSALASPGLPNIDSVSTPDSATAIFWFRKHLPEEFFAAAGQLFIMPEHVYGSIPAASLASSDVLRHPVGSGRFRFASWHPGTSIEIRSNADHYRAPARLARVIWSVAPDPATVATRFLSGQADFLEAIRPDMLAQARANKTIRLVEYPGLKYGYIVFNMRDPAHPTSPHPLFSNVALRRALTEGIDRDAVVRNVFDTLARVSAGPMTRAMPVADGSVKPIAHDSAAAARTLDSLGWRVGADGFRTRAGKHLAFRLMTPSSSKDRGRIAVLVQEQLRKLGVQVEVESIEPNVFMQEQGKHAFDAAVLLWNPSPSPSALVNTWGSVAARAAQSSNFGSFSDPVLDSALALATNESDPSRAKTDFSRAMQIFADEAPAIWLWEPMNVVGVQKRIHLAPLRADAWWAHLADWYVPAGEQIDRDRAEAPLTTTGSKGP